jgi:hypothetical protein
MAVTLSNGKTPLFFLARHGEVDGLLHETGGHGAVALEALAMAGRAVTEVDDLTRGGFAEVGAGRSLHGIASGRSALRGRLREGGGGEAKDGDDSKGFLHGVFLKLVCSLYFF